MSSLAGRCLFIAIIASSLALSSFAQNTDPNNDTGLHWYNTYDGTHENISVGTGNVFVSVPILTLPGRNGTNYSVALIANSQSWSFVNAQNGNIGMMMTRTGAVAFNPGGRVIVPGTNSDIACIGNYTFTDENGGVHTFTGSGMRTGCYSQSSCANVGGCSATPSYNILGGGDDRGEGIGADLTACKLTERNGTWFRLANCSGASAIGGAVSTPQTITMEDSNGNQITSAATGGANATGALGGGGDFFPNGTDTDTVGRSITYSATNHTIQYMDSNGTQRTITLNVQPLQLSCTYTRSGSPQTVSGTVHVITSVVFPSTNLTYIFQYDNCGSLTKIVYPSGGYTRYVFDYSNYVHSTHPPFPLAMTDIELVQKYVCRAAAVSAGSTSTGTGNTCPTAEDLTTYTPTVNSTMCDHSANSVVDPLGNKTAYQFANSQSCGLYPDVESQRQIYQGSSTLLQTVQTQYSGTYGDNPAIQTTIAPNGEQNQVQWDYWCACDHQVKEKREYDWGQGGPGILVRTTDYGSNYCDDKKPSESIYQGSSSGTLVAQTTYEFDNYTAGLSQSGAVQHDSAYNYTNGLTTGRCNVTAIQRWRNTDGATLTTRMQYDDAGNVVSSTDPGLHTTTYSYADVWGTLNNATCRPSGGNQEAYLTTVTNALGQATSKTYNSCTGTLASTTDPNNQTTSFQYDLMDRTIQINYPDNGQTGFSYNGDPVPPHITQTVLATPNPSIITDKYYDGVSNLTQTQLSDPTGAPDITVTNYDALNRASRVYNPTRCNPPTSNCGESTWGYTNYQYDALGRTTLVTKQDGNTVQTDYSAFPTVLVTDETGRQRRNAYDGLGRLVEVDEPTDQVITPPYTPAVAATGSVTITGEERFVTIYVGCGPYGQMCPQQIPDGGIVSISVNGYSESYSYGSTDTPNTIAAALASAFNNDSAAPATASASGNVVNLRARTAGSVGNSYSLSASSYTQNTTYFAAGSTSFPVSTSGSTLTGGQDATGGGPPYRVWNFSPGSVTLYSYDVLNNLTCAVQKGTDGTAFSSCSASPASWRPRSFSYDSLSRLLSASNPETGTITYGYAADGTCNPSGENLRTKTDARGVTTTYCYDALHRLKLKTHSDGTAPTDYTYDVSVYTCCGNSIPISNGIGRLVHISNDVNAATTYSFDAMGRVIHQSSCLPSYCNDTGSPVSASYDAAGQLKSLTYPSGRVINYHFNSSARLYSADGYLNVSSFWPTGAWQNATYGNSTQQQDTYNPRLQPTELKLLNSSNGSIADRQYVWTGCAEGMSTGNNGNVCGINDVLNSNRNQTYNFDALNRIVSGSESDGAFNQTMSYDVWGNVSIGGPSGGNVRNYNTRNEDTAYGFDAAGNLTNDGTYTYNFDAEERISAFNLNSNGSQVANYVYDADGNRVRKNVGSGWTEYIYFGSNIIAENSPSGWTDYVFAGGKRIAQVSASGTQYYWGDHLGTTKMTLDASGNSQCYGIYTPFGSEVSGCPTRYKFTAQERDSESGLDNLVSRLYSSNSARFMSPDVVGGDTSNPQSLNRYAYVTNNPLVFRDPMGLQGQVSVTVSCGVTSPNGSTDCQNEGSSNSQITGSGAGGDLSFLQTPSATPFLDSGGSQDDLSQLPSGTGALSLTGSSGVGFLQTTLDVAGAIPGPIGMAANIGSAGISLYQGHYGQAALSLAFAVPVVGQLGEGYRSFRAFKWAYGAAEDGMQWHHIVEQTPGNLARFGPGLIHNVENLVQVPKDLHIGRGSISALYSSKQEFAEGMTVRRWLASQSLQEQRDFGLQVLRSYGLIP